jgi:hypothetical protein
MSEAMPTIAFDGDGEIPFFPQIHQYPPEKIARRIRPN